jgi:hypothetical protein
VSKLGTLVAIPLGLFAIKQLQKQFPDEKDPKPIVEKGFTLGPAGTDMDIAPLFPEGLFVSLPGLGGTKPTGPRQKATGPTVPLGMGTDVVPFFPESAATAAEKFAAKDPFTGLAGLPKFGDISSLNFQTGLFDPAVQARLRARK